MASSNRVPLYLTGQLFGHIHKDELRVHRLSGAAGKDDVAFLLTAPGITPVYRNNPGFRIVSFDKNKRLLSDYEQYYMDIVLSTREFLPYTFIVFCLNFIFKLTQVKVMCVKFLLCKRS